jgi:hypothetical protein
MTDASRLNIKLIAILMVMIRHVRNERRLYTEERATKRTSSKKGMKKGARAK